MFYEKLYASYENDVNIDIGNIATPTLSQEETNSKHWFTTSFLQPLPYLVTP